MTVCALSPDEQQTYAMRMDVPAESRIVLKKSIYLPIASRNTPAKIAASAAALILTFLSRKRKLPAVKVTMQLHRRKSERIDICVSGKLNA